MFYATPISSPMPHAISFAKTSIVYEKERFSFLPYCHGGRFRYQILSDSLAYFPTICCRFYDATMSYDVLRRATTYYDEYDRAA